MANEFLDALRDAYGEGRPDYQRGLMEGRELSGKDADAPRIESALGTNPTTTRLRDLMAHLGAPKWMQSDPNERQVRKEMGMGLKTTGKGITGQLLGTIGADLTQDHSRELWWLLNAPQAVGNVVQEYALNKVNPDLYSAEIVRDGRGDPISKSEKDELLAMDRGLIDKESARRKKGVGVQYDKNANEYVYNKRKYAPGAVQALSIPTGVAINAGIGLLNPLGGAGGYEAVLPSEEDATKTSNVLGEIAAKYILGRTGGLLPYEEFKKVRPDVSKGEYNAYKAFKYDKALDYDFSDGDANLIPGGVLKVTGDGIHGPEAQFLGRSLPVTTTVIPFLAALAGTTLGASKRFGRGKPIRDGMLGGTAGLAAGGGLGYAIELERRKRNDEANQAYYDSVNMDTVS